MAIDRDKVLEAAQQLVEKKRYDKAIVEYQKVLAADPKDARVLLKIGEAYLKAEQFERAIATFEQVAGLHAAQGFALKAVAAYVQAREVVQRSVPHLTDRYGYLVFRIADLYVQLHRNNDAIQIYEEAAARLDAAGRQRDAIDILKKIVELDPKNADRAYRLAESLLRIGDADAAVPHLGTAAEGLVARGQHDDAINLLERALATRADPKLARMSAQLYVDRGGAKDANSAFLKIQIAFKANPKDLDTLGLLARILYVLRQPERALDVHKEAARVARDAGKTDVFDLHMETLVSRAPNDPVVRKLATQWSKAPAWILDPAGAPSPAPGPRLPQPPPRAPMPAHTIPMHPPQATPMGPPQAMPMGPPMPAQTIPMHPQQAPVGPQYGAQQQVPQFAGPLPQGQGPQYGAPQQVPQYGGLPQQGSVPQYGAPPPFAPPAAPIEGAPPMPPQRTTTPPTPPRMPPPLPPRGAPPAPGGRQITPPPGPMPGGAMPGGPPPLTRQNTPPPGALPGGGMPGGPPPLTRQNTPLPGALPGGPPPLTRQNTPPPGALPGGPPLGPAQGERTPPARPAPIPLIPRMTPPVAQRGSSPGPAAPPPAARQSRPTPIEIDTDIGGLDRLSPPFPQPAAPVFAAPTAHHAAPTGHHAPPVADYAPPMGPAAHQAPYGAPEIPYVAPEIPYEAPEIPYEAPEIPAIGLPDLPDADPPSGSWDGPKSFTGRGGFDEEALEEVEFFVTQGMYEDAIGLLDEQLARLPGHPLLLDRRREVQEMAEAAGASGQADPWGSAG